MYIHSQKKSTMLIWVLPLVRRVAVLFGDGWELDSKFPHFQSIPSFLFLPVENELRSAQKYDTCAPVPSWAESFECHSPGGWCPPPPPSPPCALSCIWSVAIPKQSKQLEVKHVGLIRTRIETPANHTNQIWREKKKSLTTVGICTTAPPPPPLPPLFLLLQSTILLYSSICNYNSWLF